MKGIDVQYVKMEDLGNIVLGEQYQNIRSLKLQDLMHWSLEIASGMQYLASKKVSIFPLDIVKIQTKSISSRQQ